MQLENSFKVCARKILIPGLMTAASFACFFLHYLLRVDPVLFAETVKNRFTDRNMTAEESLINLFNGYHKSLLYIWVVLLILTIWCFVKNRKLELPNGILILVLAFPVLENIVMKQHAVEYTYDQMKAAFLVIFIMCEVVENILRHTSTASG